MVDQAQRVLVTGAAGMLGGQVVRDAPPGVTPVPATRADADLADADQVARLFERKGPFTGVIHAAGFTAVDRAEAEGEQAYRDNALATRELAAACARADIPLVVVSTDFVFEGESEEPYAPDAPTAPLGVYGRTKLAAERAARAVHPGGTRIVRTAWLYGPGAGAHFPARILQLARERGELSVVADQRGSPTSTLELAPALWDVLRAGEPGVYHATCEGSCTWHEFAEATLALAGLNGVAVRPCTSEEFPRPAPRPRYSVLDSSRLRALRGKPLAPWREALQRYLEKETG